MVHSGRFVGEPELTQKLRLDISSCQRQWRSEKLRPVGAGGEFSNQSKTNLAVQQCRVES